MVADGSNDEFEGVPAKICQALSWLGFAGSASWVFQICMFLRLSAAAVWYQGLPSEHGMRGLGVLMKRIGGNDSLLRHVLQRGSMHLLADDFLTKCCATLSIRPLRYKEARVGNKSRAMLVLSGSTVLNSMVHLRCLSPKPSALHVHD